MITCVDVAYGSSTAVAAAVVIGEWTDSVPVESAIARIAEVPDYTPGSFYRRELPCLREVLAELSSEPRHVVIDGYVWLGPDRPGLGAHLHESLGGETPIIGVAKTRFADNPVAIELARGGSTRPLFITACGIETGVAVEHIRVMHGPFRIPTVLRQVDSLARESLAT